MTPSSESEEKPKHPTKVLKTNLACTLQSCRVLHFLVDGLISQFRGWVDASVSDKTLFLFLNERALRAPEVCAEIAKGAAFDVVTFTLLATSDTLEA